MKHLVFALGLILLFDSCKETNNPQPVENAASDQVPEKTAIGRKFNPDTAFYFIEKQVSFGPRVPGTTAHAACSKWLQYALAAYCDTLFVQNFQAKTFNGVNLEGKNLIGSFNPQNKNRILLVAHWDTRPFSDQDQENKALPVLGADDGASGVAALLEIARQLQLNPLPIGIDILLVDIEDYGYSTSVSRVEYTEDSYCLGSQYWAANPHTPGYSAKWGILLDMVSGKGSKFTREKNSVMQADWLSQQVWANASKLGFGNFFSFEITPPITDDHYYITKRSGIPVIDIIGFNPQTPTGFPAHWHTRFDDLSNVDKAVLNAAGQTVLYSIERH